MQITVSAADVAKYYGRGIPTYAAVFATRKFTDSTGVVIAKGDERNPTFSQRLPVELVGNNIRILSGNIYSTVDSSDPLVTYKVVVYDASNRPIVTAFDLLKVPSTMNPVTWDYLRIYSAARVVRDAPTYLSSQEIFALLADLSLAPFASDVIHGKVRLNRPAAVLHDPIAATPEDLADIIAMIPPATPMATEVIYGKARLSRPAIDPTHPVVLPTSEPFYQAALKSYYLAPAAHNQAGLNAAMTAIGVADAELVISDMCTISADLPSNIRPKIVGNGGFVCESGTVVINTPDHYPHPIFFGAGNILCRQTDNLFLASWLRPQVDRIAGGDDQHAMDQALASCKLTGILGGTIRIPVGDFICKIDAASNVTIIGGGGPGLDSNTFGREGTRIKPPTGATYVCKIHSATTGDTFIRNFRLMNLCLDVDGHYTTCDALYMGGKQFHGVGDGDGTAYNSTFENVFFNGRFFCNGDEGGRLGWETIDNSFKNCWFFAANDWEGMRILTENSSWHWESCTFNAGKGNSIAVNAIRVGWGTMINPDARGYAFEGYASTQVFDENFASIQLSTANGIKWANDDLHCKCTILSGRALTENDLGKIINIPGESGFVGAYFTQILSDTEGLLSWHPTAYDYVNYTNRAATLSHWSDRPQLAHTFIRINGNFNDFTVIGGADEGYRVSFDIGAGQYTGRFKAQDFTAQGKVLFNSSVVFDHENCKFFSLAFENRCPSGPVPIISGRNSAFQRRSVYNAVAMDEGVKWGYRVFNNAERDTDSMDVVEYIDNFTDDHLNPATGYLPRRYTENPIRIRNVDYGWGVAAAGLSIGHRVDNLGSHADPLLDKNLLELGYQNPLDPYGDLILKYWFSHHRQDGALELQGTQPIFKKFRTRVPLYVNAGMTIEDGGGTNTLTALDDILSFRAILSRDCTNSARGIGYGPGTGDQVIQGTSKTTAVTCNKANFMITTFTANVATATQTTFQVNNTFIRNTDKVEVDAERADGQPLAIGVKIFKSYQRDGVIKITHENNSGSPDGNAYYIRVMVFKGLWA